MSKDFRCNIPECAGVLSENTCLTSCGHAFCYSHAQEWFRTHSNCPACNSNVQLAKINLNRKNLTERKKLCLIGLSPGEMLEALKTGLEFWINQHSIEAEMTNTNEMNKNRVLREKIAQAEKTVCKAYEAYRSMKQQLEDSDKRYKQLELSYKELTQSHKRPPAETPQIFEPPSNKKLNSGSFFNFNPQEVGDTDGFRRPLPPVQAVFFTPNSFLHN